MDNFWHFITKGEREDAHYLCSSGRCCAAYMNELGTSFIVAILNMHVDEEGVIVVGDGVAHPRSRSRPRILCNSGVTDTLIFGG